MVLIADIENARALYKHKNIKIYKWVTNHTLFTLNPKTQLGLPDANNVLEELDGKANRIGDENEAPLSAS